MAALRDLGAGVWVSQTTLWQTNSILALAAEDALLVDPAYEPEEVETLATRAREGGRSVHVLVTHGDYDHVCGIGYLPEAEIVTGPATAARISSGQAGSQLAEAAVEWGLDWPTELRVSRIVEPGRFECGRFVVDAIAADGHTDDGLAYVLVEQGVLAAGDYFSPITIPFVVGSVDAFIAAQERLLTALEEHALRWVVPGHGPVLTAAEAAEVGSADLAYLESLRAAAAESRQRDLSAGLALLHVYDVEPPRADTPDFAVYGLRAWNARAALAGA